MKLLENMPSIVVIALEILFFHTSIVLRAYLVDTIYSKENTSLLKINGKKNFNRLKYAEHKIFRICIDVYKFYESDDDDKIYDVPATLKDKKLKVSNILMKKIKTY